MTREELLTEAFGRDDFPPCHRMVELLEGVDVLSHVEVYMRRLVVFRPPMPGQVAEASTTLVVAQLARLCTDPARVGEGYASAMVRRALQELSENKPLSFATALADPDDERLVEFLGRFGFAHPPGTPPGFLVVRLAGRGDEWPHGRVRLFGDWK